MFWQYLWKKSLKIKLFALLFLFLLFGATGFTMPFLASYSLSDNIKNSPTESEEVFEPTLKDLLCFIQPNEENLVKETLPIEGQNGYIEIKKAGTCTNTNSQTKTFSFVHWILQEINKLDEEFLETVKKFNPTVLHQSTPWDFLISSLQTNFLNNPENEEFIAFTSKRDDTNKLIRKTQDIAGPLDAVIEFPSLSLTIHSDYKLNLKKILSFLFSIFQFIYLSIHHQLSQTNPDSDAQFTKTKAMQSNFFNWDTNNNYVPLTSTITWDKDKIAKLLKVFSGSSRMKEIVFKSAFKEILTEEFIPIGKNKSSSQKDKRSLYDWIISAHLSVIGRFTVWGRSVTTNLNVSQVGFVKDEIINQITDAIPFNDIAAQTITAIQQFSNYFFDFVNSKNSMEETIGLISPDYWNFASESTSSDTPALDFPLILDSFLVLKDNDELEIEQQETTSSLSDFFAPFQKIINSLDLADPTNLVAAVSSLLKLSNKIKDEAAKLNEDNRATINYILIANAKAFFYDYLANKENNINEFVYPKSVFSDQSRLRPYLYNQSAEEQNKLVLRWFDAKNTPYTAVISPGDDEDSYTIDYFQPNHYAIPDSFWTS